MKPTVLMLSLLVACGSPQPPPSTGIGNAAPDAGAPPPLREDVTCGAATCGPDEYCEHRCLCCGISNDPATARGESVCVPLDAACHDANPPECQQRTVYSPCA